MKRKWAYLGAVLPLSTAVSAWASSAGADADPVRPLRKNALPEDDGTEKASDGQEQPLEKAAPGVKAPPRDASQEELLRVLENDGVGELAALGDAGAKIFIPNTDGGMYAPVSTLTASHAKPMAGGGATGVKFVEQDPDENEGPGTDPIPTDDPNLDPADEDAMAILLGGMAEAAGDGATTSGDIVFDIIDYGTITIGYGYATFAASGVQAASADTFFDVVGADLVFSYVDEGCCGTSAYSITHVLAIDFEDDLVLAQQALNSIDWTQLLAEGPFAQNRLGEEQDISVDGNFALISMSGNVFDARSPSLLAGSDSLTFDNIGSTVSTWLQSEQARLSLAGEAEGVDSLVSAMGSLLEIDDQYSSVSGAIIGVA